MPWFCCLFLRARTIVGFLGCELVDLGSSALDLDASLLTWNELLHPGSLTWLTGFSLSSAVAQDVTIGSLLEDDAEPAVVATDDTIFIPADLVQARHRLFLLDAAYHHHGIRRTKEKNVDLADEFVALGCHISADPPRVNPEINKI